MAHQHKQRIVRICFQRKRFRTSGTNTLWNVLDPAARAGLGQRELCLGLIRALVHAAILTKTARAANSTGHLVPALLLRLVSLAGMRFAIGRAVFRLAAAEMKLMLGRIADRPAAHTVVDRQHGGEIAVIELKRIFLDDRCGWDMRANRHARRTGQSRAFGARRTGTAGETQPMHFAYYGVAGNAAQHAGDLTCREPLGPKILELLDAVFGPVRLSHPVLLPVLPALRAYQIS